MTAGTRIEASHLQEETIAKEGIMDRVWLYMGGMILAFAVFIYFVITTVRSMSPPAY